MTNWLISLFSTYITFWSLCSGSEITEKYDIGHLLRNKRHLLFPNPQGSETKVQVLFGLGLPMEGEVSMTLGYVLKCNYNLPYNSSIYEKEEFRYEKSADVVFSEPRNVKATQGKLSRWNFYRILERAFQTFGSGKACLLRMVCEAAETPFKEGHGLLGELVHVLFTPSTTFEEYEVYSDREYHAAELIGYATNGMCKSLYSECIVSPLDYFSSKR
ncbi:uncharacterized protein LOC122498821 [Leptopilina heterotoma]|uniref:uncharacterized protein LOC122498821 n=1 Tax=Leptopilina heterotoma TaxID=63436 RepID=UPI001CA9A2D2|nr:uncharacterized protein LOC122498821 [Leptopilina heterotoma]